MTDSEEDDTQDIEFSDDNETEGCMEFQIGLMIEPDTHEISIVTPNGNRPISHLSVAPSNNGVEKKRKLNSEKAHSSRSTTSPYTSTSASSTSKTHSPNAALDTATILSAIDNLRELMTKVADKTDQLYQEFQEIKNKQNTWQDDSILDRTVLGIPCGTKEELTDFEEKIKNDDVPRKLLKQFLSKLDDRTWDKYIAKCLGSCLNIELAIRCSFYGKNNKIEVQHLEFIKVIKECVETKFPSIRSGEMLQVIMRWFHYATDRFKRKRPAEVIDVS